AWRCARHSGRHLTGAPGPGIRTLGRIRRRVERPTRLAAGDHAGSRLAAMNLRSIAARRRLRGRSYDVVFHKPWVSSLITTRPTLPVGGAEAHVLLIAGGV